MCWKMKASSWLELHCGVQVLMRSCGDDVTFFITPSYQFKAQIFSCRF